MWTNEALRSFGTQTTKSCKTRQMRPHLETRFIIPGFSTKVTLPPEIVRFKVLHLLAIWEGEALAELLRHGSAGASPSRPMNLQVPKPDDLSGRVGRKAREGELNCAIAVGTSPSPRFARPSQREQREGG